MILWHNPRCSKSRTALKLLEQHHPQVRRYLEDTPTEAELRNLSQKLGLSAQDMIRKNEATYKELKLDAQSSDDTLFAAMAAHPILIERPILINDTRAAIGRPPENLLDLV